MNTQPEALRLADALRKLHESKKIHPSGPGGQMLGCEQYSIIASGIAFEELQDAAQELRRLHEVNQEMLGALEKVRDAFLGISIEVQAEALKQARAAIEKAEGRK